MSDKEKADIRITFCMSEKIKSMVEEIKEERQYLTWRIFIENGLAQYCKDQSLIDEYKQPKRNAPVSTRISQSSADLIHGLAKFHDISFSKAIEAVIDIGAKKIKNELGEH